MKKLISLVLVLAMVLGLSVTAFAEGGYDLYINEVQVTSDMLLEGGVIDNSKFDNVITGTVKYTPANGDNPAKLTLDGATIVSTMGTYRGNDAIYTESDAIVIELIGNNTVNATSHGFDIYGGDVTFIGNGSLTITSTDNAIYTSGDCTFSMGGTLTATNSNGIAICPDGSIYITAGAGKITAHGNADNTGAVYFDENGVGINGYKTAVGSADFNETDESKMTTATANGWRFTVGDPAVTAKTVVLTAYPTPKSGSTTITATKAEPELAYTIVIPTATTLNDEAHTDVLLGGDSGKAGITVTTGNAKTNVYYTVDLTNATLTDGTNTITTTYAYAQGEGEYAELTNGTKVTVYEGGTVKDSTVQVTADEDSWAAAPAGTYTASVVFNFATEEVVTIADILPEDFPEKVDEMPENAWVAGGDDGCMVIIEDDLVVASIHLPLTTPLTKVNDSTYTYSLSTEEGSFTCTFNFENGKLKSVVLAIQSEEYSADYTFTEPVTVADLLATVDGGFPTDQNFAWINGDSYCMCLNDSGVDKLGFYHNTYGALLSLKLSEIVSPVNGGYRFDDGSYSTFDFEMTGGELTSIVVTFAAGYGSGTYAPGK